MLSHVYMYSGLIDRWHIRGTKKAEWVGHICCLDPHNAHVRAREERTVINSSASLQKFTYLHQPNGYMWEYKLQCVLADAE